MSDTCFNQATAYEGNDSATNPHADPDARYRVFTEGDNLYEAMIADILAARQSVLFETYIFKEDGIGRRFLDALKQAAQSGVEVYLRLDAFGSKGLISQRAITEIRTSGVTVEWIGAWNWRHPLDYQRRDHRKLLVIDAAIAYVGGFNIGAESSREYEGEKRWRDTHVRLTGAIAERAHTLFWDFKTDRACTKEAWVDGSLLMPNYGVGCRYRWRCRLHGRLRAARERIWLTTPYFVPDSGTQKRLKEAAGRGVDVRVLVPAKSDVPMTQWAARISYGDLLQAGVKLYEYEGRILHAKTVVIDDDWSAIGTANLDYRSLFTNYELNFLSRSSALNQTLATIFLGDLKPANPVSYASWAKRPYLQHLSEFIGWAARRWL